MKLNESVQRQYMYRLDLKALATKSIKDENIKFPEDDGRPWLVQSMKDVAI